MRGPQTLRVGDEHVTPESAARAIKDSLYMPDTTRTSTAWGVSNGRSTTHKTEERAFAKITTSQVQKNQKTTKAKEE